mmetsp:Transcript_10831/g.24172  ORF Transcript_10831/g.24172 Transcript_10831/m.24172 type:complete len:300 (+) Transcript_10831:809-1708(+)
MEDMLHPTASRRGSMEPNTTAERASCSRVGPSWPRTTGTASPKRRVFAKMGMTHPRCGRSLPHCACASRLAGRGWTTAATAKRAAKPAHMQLVSAVLAAARMGEGVVKETMPKAAAARKTATGNGRSGRNTVESSAVLRRLAVMIAIIWTRKSAERTEAGRTPKHSLERQSTEAPPPSSRLDDWPGRDGPFTISLPAASTYASPARSKKSHVATRPAVDGSMPRGAVMSGTARKPPPTAEPPMIAIESNLLILRFCTGCAPGGCQTGWSAAGATSENTAIGECARAEAKGRWGRDRAAG